jgi:hypothetical protein
MTMAQVFVSNYKHLALVWLFGASLLVYLLIKWVPMSKSEVRRGHGLVYGIGLASACCLITWYPAETWGFVIHCLVFSVAVYDWTNHLRVGIYTAIWYISLLFMFLQFPLDSVLNDPDENAIGVYRKQLETALWGILPMFILGMGISWARLHYVFGFILVRFRCVCCASNAWCPAMHVSAAGATIR